jgi:FixJ family two-component response regulator
LSTFPVISVVDDDESIRVATKNLVRSLGFNVRTFASAEDFLLSDCLRGTSCVIADVHMPGLNGVELQSLLKARGHHIPIIFITAFPEERIRSRALRSGAVGFISKPFHAQALIECIDTALKGHWDQPSS